MTKFPKNSAFRDQYKRAIYCADEGINEEAHRATRAEREQGDEVKRPNKHRLMAAAG